MSQKEFETVQEAALRTGKKENTVRSWVNRGHVKYVHEEYGRKLLSVAAVDAYNLKARDGRPKKGSNTSAIDSAEATGKE